MPQLVDEFGPLVDGSAPPQLVDIPIVLMEGSTQKSPHLVDEFGTLMNGLESLIDGFASPSIHPHS